MTLFLAALAASYLVVLLIGLLGGLYLNRGMRRLPEHPTLRSYGGHGAVNVARHERRLRLIESSPKPYDYEAEGG